MANTIDPHDLAAIEELAASRLGVSAAEKLTFLTSTPPVAWLEGKNEGIVLTHSATGLNLHLRSSVAFFPYS